MQNFNFGSLDSQIGQAQGFGSLDAQGQPSLIQQAYNFGSPAAHASVEAAGVMHIEIRKLYMGLTRPQADQHRRSYDVVASDVSLNLLADEIGRNGVAALDTAAISNVFSQENGNFVRFSGTPDGAVDIDNGWWAERFRFTMVVDVFRNGRFARTEFVSGHTDEAAATQIGMTSVKISPRMVFTINHVTEARMRRMDGYGNPIPLVTRSNSVVRNQGFGGLNGMGESLYLTRPSDVLKAVDKVQLYAGMQQAAAVGDPTAMTYQDLDSLLTHVPMMSNDANLMVPTFTSRMVKGLFENSLNEYDPMNMDGSAAGSLASQRIQDTPFSNSGFIHVMNRKLANGVGTTAQFTYSDLLMLDPTIDDRADVFGRAYETGAIVIPDGRDVSSLGAAETIALHATAIAQSTLALMSTSGVATLAYNANNMSGQTELTLQAVDGMDNDGALFQRLEVLKSRLILECLNIVSEHDQRPFEVDVFADAFNDVYIQLAWENERRDYVIPAFASSSLAPIVTNDLSRLSGMAQAIDQVVDACKSILSPGSHDSLSNLIAVQGDGNGRAGGLAGDY
jgi:hypothetical protein